MDPKTPVDLSVPSPSSDLKKAKAAFWKSAAKLTLVATASLVPALIGWLDSKTQATTALTAAAAEKISNESAYEAFAERIAALEQLVKATGDAAQDQTAALKECHDTLIRHDERIRMLGRRHGVRTAPAVRAPASGGTGSGAQPAGALRTLLDEAKSKKPLDKKRPKPARKLIQQAQEQMQEEFGE